MVTFEDDEDPAAGSGEESQDEDETMEDAELTVKAFAETGVEASASWPASAATSLDLDFSEETGRIAADGEVDVEHSGALFPLIPLLLCPFPVALVIGDRGFDRDVE